MTRKLPSLDVFASCPLDGKILEYYAGTFEGVYVSLNPFIKPVTIDKAEFEPDTYPSRENIVTNCKSVSWAEVVQLAKLPSLAAVDIGLRTMIGGLKKEFQNRSYAAAIDTLSDTQSILPPPEGCFSDLLHDKILQSIQRLGYEWLWIGDEFCTERKLYWIDDLKKSEDLTIGRFNVFTPDKQLLWTIHWDSHFSFLCSSQENLAAIQNTSSLEGFFCTPSTEVYWSLWS
ncbi:MAG TPA: DUF2711 family protein [Edaphobacter sp.]